MIDALKQTEKFKEFFEINYKKELSKLVAQGKKSLLVNFNDLLKFDIELVDELLNYPEETIKSAEITLEQFDFIKNKLRVRFYNFPASQQIMIKDIRSNHLNNLVVVEGIVRQASDVRPQVTSAKFECPSCGNTIFILQLDTKFKEPNRCNCGRKGRFRLIDKELIDAQHLTIEESPETLEGGEQPKRISIFLKEDLVEPKMEKRTTPGSRVRVIGIIKEIPIMLKSGMQSTRYNLIMDSNYIEPVDETFEEIEVGKEEEEKIKNLAKDPEIYNKLINSIAPSIYGHEDIKAALILQMVGGTKKIGVDRTVTRGDIHLLLVGDPGCIAGNSQVSLLYKGMEKIQNIGNKHLQPIKEVVTKIRKNEKDKPYDFATLFHYYPKQPVLKIVTETGKEVVCTYNQPFLTKQGWERADNILLNTKIRVMPKIPNYIKKLAPTNFVRVDKKTGPLKEVDLPDKFTPELASLCGYIIGDGNIHSQGYRVTCYINNEEKDLIEKISELWKITFNLEPIIITRNVNESIKTIDDGNGLLRQFVSTQQMHLMEINSRQVAQSLSFLSNKRVPQQIFQSPKYVVAKFISWLFEADGCAFGKGRGRTAIQLKSSSNKLLHDVQLLLLYFGIHSRIIEDNLCIRRSYDMELFAKHIGFNSEKKKRRLNNVLEVIKIKSYIQKRKKLQRWEKVVKVIPNGIIDVYDFEVPVSHTFIANGIICHNSGKSRTLQFITKIAPKGRFISGKSASAAGITATVVRDEFLRGWALEAGAMVLAHKGIAIIDELDKMTSEDRDALHEAMEQQQITINKANIQATLKSETTVLAAANPKFGRFDPYQPIASQIDLPPTLINRFDLIFPVRDLPSKELDEKIASHVLKLQQKPEELKQEIDSNLLRKYISYVRKKSFPKLTDSAIDEIKKFYVGLRNYTVSGEESIKPIPITARQLEALVRLSEASAKIRLGNKVTRDDAKRAINILKHCLMQVGFDYETGRIDIDRISTGIPASQRSRIFIIREIINNFYNRGIKTIPLEDLISEASNKNITEDQVEEVIETLKRSGEIYEPTRNKISKVA